MLSVVRDQQTDLSAVEPPSAASSLRDGAVVFSGRRRLRVLVVDALPVVQAGVRRFLQDVPLILGVDEAETGEQAVGIARSLRPDVILLDPVPPDMLLKEAVRRLRAVSPESRIVIFTSRLTPSRRAEAISLGVSGLVSALSAVLARRTIGGTTGDTIGATVALTEVAVCLALSGMSR